MLICRAFIYHITINTIIHLVQASQCLRGQDIFAKVRENSPYGEVVAKFSSAEGQTANSVRWCLTGEDADWFFLEGRTIRLNTSSSRILDREVQGTVLMAALKCYEDETIQNEYRVMIEILNENDNRPIFLEKGGLTFDISELTPINAVAFSVQARDADDDIIMYIIDKSLPDASHFRIDLSNSSDVILDKPLDYETKTQLRIILHAVEMNTMERYSTATMVTVNVLDGDDQYPQFQPCTVLTQEMVHPVCTNPVYKANITEMQKDAVLYFSPGPIHAVDGDKGLGTPVVYTILSGSDNGRFHINNETGELVLKRPVKSRIRTPTLRLQIMTSQVDDPRKYTVATALIRVLAGNQFPPQFNTTIYKGFVMEDTSLATLVSTYGNDVLVIQAMDHDFKNGVNPKINYSLRQTFNSSKLFHITQEGFLVAKTSQLRAFERHILQVLATDEESGDMANVSVDIDVLQKGQQAPRSPFGEERLYDVNVIALGGIAAAVLLLLAACFASLQLAKCRRKRRDPTEGGAATPETHRNLDQQINPRRFLNFSKEVFCHDEAFQDCDISGSILYGKQGIYIKKEDMPLAMTCDREYDGSEVPSIIAPVFIIPQPLTRGTSIMYGSRTPHGSLSDPALRVDGATPRANEATKSPHQTAKEEEAPETAQLKQEWRETPDTCATSSASAVWKMEVKRADGGFDSANPIKDSMTSAACLTEQTDSDDGSITDNDADEDEMEEVEKPYKSM